MSYLQKEAIAAAKLKEIIAHAGQDDPELIADMIEGETDYFEMLARTDRKLLETLGDRKGLADVIGEMQARLAMYDRRIDTLRTMIFDALMVVDERKVALPTGTLTLNAKPASVIITDEAALPESCVKVKTTRSPDRAAIKAKLEAGEAVPGATLSNGGVTLAIRRT